MIRELKRGLVEYIAKSTGIDRNTVVRVLRAEEAYLVLQIKKALQNGKTE